MKQRFRCYDVIWSVSWIILISFRSVYSFIWDAPITICTLYTVHYTRLDTISFIIWFRVYFVNVCAVFILLACPFFLCLASCLGQTYSNFFQSLFNFRLISNEWNGPKFSFDLKFFYFYFECFALEIVIRIFVPWRKTKTFLRFHYFQNNAKKYAKKHYRFESFKQFRIYYYYFFHSGDDCCKR